MPASDRGGSPPQRHAPTQMTRAHNVTTAFMKVTTAPLHTLTDTMLESIARSHANERDRPALLTELRARLAVRKEREGADG